MPPSSKPKNPENSFQPPITLSNAHQHLLGQVAGRPYIVIIGMLGMLIVLGSTGYMIIEGWGLFDALYMTIITMTTIGFGEVQPLSQTGRIFTIGLIIIGVIVASYTATTTIELLTSKEFLIQLRNRRRRKALERISNHCIICGFGRMGRSLAYELQARNWAIIAIDPEREALERCEAIGVLAVQGNGSNEDTLYQAGIERASSLVTATPSDAENVFIILTARSINPNLQIITRCNAEDSIPKLEKAGADTVISPYTIAGRRIAHMLTHPNVTNFLDGILEFGDHHMRLEEFIIGQDSPLAGLMLREAKLKVAVLAVNHPNQAVIAHPHANTKLLPGAEIIVMGLDQELNKLEQLVKG